MARLDGRSRRSLSLGAGLLALAVVVAPAGADRTATGGQADFVLAAHHPRAIEQPTDVGRALSTLFPWRGRLYAGYGDYGANTGPISISPYEPWTGRFTEVWVSDTEAIYNYRAIRDRLYAPAIDRRAKADYAVGEPWADDMPVGTTHAYDMVTMDGNDLWIVGSKGYQAAAWRSLDDGETWHEALLVDALDADGGDFARFYFAGLLEGTLYVQAVDYRGGQHARSLRFDGIEWTEGPDLLLGLGAGWRPIELAGRLVVRSGRRGGPLIAFDGSASSVLVDWQVLDAVMGAGELYALAWHVDETTGSSGAISIIRSRDLLTWQKLTVSAPAEATSLAVLQDKLYLGTKYGDLWRYDGAQEWRPAVVPPPVWRVALPCVSAGG